MEEKQVGKRHGKVFIFDQIVSIYMACLSMTQDPIIGNS